MEYVMEAKSNKSRIRNTIHPFQFQFKQEDTIYGELPTTDSYAESIGIKKSDKHKVHYDPPLPVSVVKETMCKYDVNKNTYGGGKDGRIKISKDKKDHQQKYDPPLPVSVIKEEIDEKYKNKGGLYSKVSRNGLVKNEPHYDPPLPHSMLEIKSTKGKHSTEKPVALMEWVLNIIVKKVIQF